MMMRRSNGSFIGHEQYDTNLTATGIWSLQEVYNRRADSNWPAAPATSTSTTISVGNNGYYSYAGWMANVEYTSGNTANIGSATGDKALLNTDQITGLSSVGNPGRTGFSLWVNGTGGNAGWTRLDGESTISGTNYTGYIFRADCGYTADSSNLQNWNQHWQNNSGGYAGTHTYYGTHFRYLCSQGYQTQPTSGTVVFDFS